MDNPDLDPKWGEPSPFHDPFVLANFNARPTDVLITTPPKAGTTWMQNILHQLKTGGDPEFKNIDHIVPWLEFPRPGKSTNDMLERFEKMEHPRLFKTHCTYSQTPGIDTAKIILSSRDPRDCCVSFYHHVNSMTDTVRTRIGMDPPTNFEEYFEQWMEFAAWFRSMESWWPHKDKENVLWLRYEDMVADLSKTIDVILNFLDWKLSTEQKSKVMKYCSFSWMKQHDEKFSTDYETGEPMFKPKSFIRKGIVGDHKILLNEAQERRIRRKAKECLSQECLDFIGFKI